VGVSSFVPQKLPVLNSRSKQLLLPKPISWKNFSRRTEGDYPIDVMQKFRSEWRFITMDVPGKSGILSPELYQMEREKFQTLMEETRELATVALREEFAGIVRHMVERRSGEEDGKPKKFKNSMMEKMGEFLESFSDRNLFDDDKLAELVDQARDVVN
jgi:hypothetical protein